MAKHFSGNAVQASTNTPIFRSIPPIRSYRKDLLFGHQSVGLVPTMGALHAGHLSMIRRAAAENNNVFVSIFVNPTQFGVNEDLDSYPRTWDSDLAQIHDLNKEFDAEKRKGRITAVFAPTSKEMYPALPPSSEVNGNGSFINITPLSTILEGASRPVFFRGVATVCMKLFNIMTPDRVYFGQKDVQQTVVIRRMVKDFALGTEVVLSETTREPDGLAMSSRNVYLGSRRRAVATVLITALRMAEEKYKRGARNRSDILDPAIVWARRAMETQLRQRSSKRSRFEIDYISLADPDTMEEVEIVGAEGAILSGAIKMLPVEDLQSGEDGGLGGGTGPVRLIDNIILRP